jgi:alpha-tubulin suppressor-like RCC1 family protein
MTSGRRWVAALAFVSGLVNCAGVLGLDDLSPRRGDDRDEARDAATTPPPVDTGSVHVDATDDAFVRPASPQLLASKWYHTCAEREGGRLFCFGRNTHGELGDGTNDDRAVPTLVAGTLVDHVEQVATGLEHTCILQKAGVVRCWGSNRSGQLGDGSNTPRSAIGPAVIGTFSRISTGMYHTCALTPDAAVRCWGDNYFGSLGDGTRNDNPYAQVVLGVGDVVSLATGGWHTCAAVKNGSVYCWGYNRYGQLGYATPVTDADAIPEETHSTVPTVVPGIDHVVQVTAGEHHTCARRDDGTVWCWGRNDGFSVGDGTHDDMRTVPTPTVGDLHDVAEVVAGSLNTCARLVDGTVRCWGRNAFGELATGVASAGSAVPGPPIAGLQGVTLLTAGDHACAFDGERALRCWGRNDYGQVGVASDGDAVLVPTVVPF